MFEAGFGVEYSSNVSLQTLLNNKNNFIGLYQKVAVNREKTFEQGNVVYSRMYNAIENNVPVIFNEPLANELNVTNKFNEIFGANGNLTQQLKEKYLNEKYTSLRKVLDDIEKQISFPERDKTCKATLLEKKLLYSGALYTKCSTMILMRL